MRLEKRFRRMTVIDTHQDTHSRGWGKTHPHTRDHNAHRPTRDLYKHQLSAPPSPSISPAAPARPLAHRAHCRSICIPPDSIVIHVPWCCRQESHRPDRRSGSSTLVVSVGQ